ncbi:MAG TPA: 3-oxoacid CoA-transferase subunit A [Candidatus Binatia bacterium]|nr:3-oxoacid CoA-transferase subunit A [Candidatus Binatia bacterium]
MDKVVASAAAAVADVADGATLLFGGFGVVQGWPNSLLLALRAHGARDLTLVFNTPGVGPLSAQMLAEAGLVRKIVASFAAYPTRRTPIEDQIREGKIALELVPQGTLAERVRAGGAGIPAFYTPTGVGTLVAEGKERRTFRGREYVLETALTADFAFVRAHRADRLGNLVYRRGARNLHPPFATGGRVTVAEVDEVVAPGDIDPESVVTPGIYVDRVVRTEHPLDVEEVRALSRRYGRAVHVEPRPDVGGLPPDLMTRRAALLLRDGEYVNLGLGLPTLLSNHIPGVRDVVLHSENGMLAFGPLAEEGDEDVDLYNASGQLVRMLPGAAFFDSVAAHGMARGGRVSTVVLGAFQVSQRGDLANWNVPASGKGGIGGAMDLAAGGARVLVVTYHATRSGEPKLVERCTYPLTALACVREIVTDLAYLTVEPEGFVLREVAPGVDVERVRALTGAPLRVASDLRTMPFA